MGSSFWFGARIAPVSLKQASLDGGAMFSLGKVLALRVCDPTDIAPARVIDRRLIPGRALAADHATARVVIRDRALAVCRRAADAPPAAVVHRARLRRCFACDGERQRGEDDRGRCSHTVILTAIPAACGRCRPVR